MDAAAQARRRTEDELRQALDRGEFEILYQPMFNLATGRATAVEAFTHDIQAFFIARW